MFHCFNASCKLPWLYDWHWLSAQHSLPPLVQKQSILTCMLQPDMQRPNLHCRIRHVWAKMCAYTAPSHKDTSNTTSVRHNWWALSQMHDRSLGIDKKTSQHLWNMFSKTVHRHLSHGSRQSEITFTEQGLAQDAENQYRTFDNKSHQNSFYVTFNQYQRPPLPQCKHHINGNTCRQTTAWGGRQYMSDGHKYASR